MHWSHHLWNILCFPIFWHTFLPKWHLSGWLILPRISLAIEPWFHSPWLWLPFFLVLWHLVFFGNSTHAYWLTPLHSPPLLESHKVSYTISHPPTFPLFGTDISSRGLPWMQVIHSMSLPRCFKSMCSTTNSMLPWDLPHSSSTFPWLGGTIAWDESSEFSLIFTTNDLQNKPGSSTLTSLLGHSIRMQTVSSAAVPPRSWRLTTGSWNPSSSSSSESAWNIFNTTACLKLKF